MISILLPVFNGFKTLSETLDSIFDQNFKNFELLLVDDGSTDNSSEIYEKIDDNRLRLFRKKQTGLASTLNYGIQRASYEFISRIDQDDLMENDFLTNHINAFKSNPSKICVTNWALKIDEKNKVKGEIKPSLNPNLQRLEILFLNKYVHSAVTFRKSEILKLGGYPTDSKIQPPEDYFLWSKLFVNYNDPFYVIPKFLTRYRVTSGSMTQSDSEIAKNAQAICVANLTNCLNTENKSHLEWVKYASYRIHRIDSKNEIKRLPQTILILVQLCNITNVKLSFYSLISVLGLVARICLPKNAKAFIRLFKLRGAL
jgi:glycosyltransferase involved in cell wall biosynthesis